MRRHAPVLCFVALSAFASFAKAGQFNIVDVPSVMGAGEPEPNAITFSELRDDEGSSPVGLVPFEVWANSKPLQKKFLSPFPSYTEPSANVTVEGVTKPVQEKLRMYVAEARFTVSRPPASIDLARYATVNFLERLDPAIEHRPISAAEADNASNKNPDRQWCEALANATCVQSKYRLEGKLPMAVQLVNQLTDGNKLADFLEFQSELRILEPQELDQDGLKQLTGIDAPVTGAIEQTIFHVNQLMQFGKFLAVFQGNPAEPNHTTATAFIALALKARLLEHAKKYENVPVLRNLVPGMVLAGKSSFNAGESISAGLPIFARNNLKAVAAILDSPRPRCPSCFPLEACQAMARLLKLDDVAGKTGPASSLKAKEQRLEPDLMEPCRPDVDPFTLASACRCQGSLLKQAARACAKGGPAHGQLLRAAQGPCEVTANPPRKLANGGQYRSALNACP